MGNYAPNLARDKGGEPMQQFNTPSSVVASRASENAITSSVITLGHDTTALEIAAVGGTGFMRWVRTGDTTASVVAVAGSTANFNHVIPSGTMRRFVVPIETANVNPGSVQGVNRALGLYQRVAYQTAAAASILTTEY